MGRAEIPILAGAVATRSHVDGGAEQLISRVQIAQPFGLGGCQEPGQQRSAVVVDGSCDGLPVAGVDALIPSGRRHQLRPPFAPSSVDDKDASDVRTILVAPGLYNRT